MSLRETDLHAVFTEIYALLLQVIFAKYVLK